jgi:fructosamine-3-kinase
MSFFLKWNPGADAEMFAAEADGLEALEEPGALRTPAVLGWGGSGTPSDPGWLLLEFVPKGRPASGYGHLLGEGLARLHDSAVGHSRRASANGPAFGWHRDNFIGSLPQTNNVEETWADFWRKHRVEPQLRMARERGYFTGREGRVLDQILDRMPELLPESDGQVPGLLHGDLWSGNYYPGPGGEPVLIDPAVYLGAGEVDLAMMELFGSFPSGFRQAYGSVRYLPPEYDAFRRDLYQLYYLLVHVNLFGGGYVGGVLRAAEHVLRSA